MDPVIQKLDATAGFRIFVHSEKLVDSGNYPIQETGFVRFKKRRFMKPRDSLNGLAVERKLR